MRVATLAALVSLSALGVAEAETHAPRVLFSEDFEGDLSRWRPRPREQFEIVLEPGGVNHVLELRPKKGDFALVLIEGSDAWRDVRVEGRFLFPAEGDGYLGFVHNYQASAERMDFGCLYVKSNGSYIRISPHHDGNPSWRLYEELRVDLEGERRMEVGRWYDFRFEVAGRRSVFYVDDFTVALVEFDLFPQDHGAVGFEPRPGGGERVWLDDVRVSKLPARQAIATSLPTTREELSWEVLGPLPPAAAAGTDVPSLPEEGWRPLAADRRGALITGLSTQYRSGENEIAYLRTRFEAAEDESGGPRWLAVSSANQLDIWLNGHYRGSVAPERFIWSDFLTSSEHPGARVPIHPRAGRNELLVRVHGHRFAGGGLFAALIGAP